MDHPATEKLPSVENKIDLAPSESRAAEPRVAESRVDDEPILLEMALREAELAKRAERGKEGESAAAPKPVPRAPEIRREDPEAIALNEHGNIRSCEACGFPVSQGRKLCLDCEGKGIASDAPEFLSQLSAPNESWLRTHMYLVGAVLVAAATVALLVWFR